MCCQGRPCVSLGMKKSWESSSLQQQRSLSDRGKGFSLFFVYWRSCVRALTRFSIRCPRNTRSWSRNLFWTQKKSNSTPLPSTGSSSIMPSGRALCWFILWFYLSVLRLHLSLSHLTIGPLLFLVSTWRMQAYTQETRLSSCPLKNCKFEYNHWEPYVQFLTLVTYVKVRGNHQKGHPYCW